MWYEIARSDRIKDYVFFLVHNLKVQYKAAIEASENGEFQERTIIRGPTDKQPFNGTLVYSRRLIECR